MKWSQKVKTISTYPPKGLFNKSGSVIASVMARSDVSPKGLGSAIRMVQFYINRAGKTLSPERKFQLEKAKKILQEKNKKEKEKESRNRKKKSKSKSRKSGGLVFRKKSRKVRFSSIRS